jgi:hypothetical protein
MTAGGGEPRLVNRAPGASALTGTLLATPGRSGWPAATASNSIWSCRAAALATTTASSAPARCIGSARPAPCQQKSRKSLTQRRGALRIVASELHFFTVSHGVPHPSPLHDHTAQHPAPAALPPTAITLDRHRPALPSTRNHPRTAVQGCVLRPLCLGDARQRPGSKGTTVGCCRRSEPVWWAWPDLNQRPHPYQPMPVTAVRTVVSAGRVRP